MTVMCPPRAPCAAGQSHDSQLTVTVRGSQGWRLRHSIGKPGQADCFSCFMAIFKHRIGLR